VSQPLVILAKGWQEGERDSFYFRPEKRKAVDSSGGLGGGPCNYGGGSLGGGGQGAIVHKLSSYQELDVKLDFPLPLELIRGGEGGGQPSAVTSMIFIGQEGAKA